MAEAIPAIWPLDRRKLRGNIGAFGTRVHPITGRVKGHQGVDLGSNIGTPVYATGDGFVAFNNEGTRGYGRQILLNHGFGYKTRYAHLSKIEVMPGQKVKRGEKIGGGRQYGTVERPPTCITKLYIKVSMSTRSTT